MKNNFSPGDQKVFRRIITPEDQAAFHGAVLHAVYSTFALARDFEWSSRLFFIDMMEADEEGCGTFVHVDHKNPAFVGEEITITATVETIRGNELICTIEGKVDDRIIAVGRTGQKMLKRERLIALFTKP